MDQHEIALLEQYAPTDPELKSLWEDHVLYEKQVEKLEGKVFRTPTEDQTLKAVEKAEAGRQDQVDGYPGSLEKTGKIAG